MMNIPRHQPHQASMELPEVEKVVNIQMGTVPEL